MGAQKILVTLFSYIFHVKTEWNIVWEYLKTKTFSRDTNILPQMHWTSNNFGNSAATIGGFWVLLNYLILNLSKRYVQKTSRCGTGCTGMLHCNRLDYLDTTNIGYFIQNLFKM